jgi:hypothetical protein
MFTKKLRPLIGHHPVNNRLFSCQTKTFKLKIYNIILPIVLMSAKLDHSPQEKSIN